ncbi:MAG: molybdopterin-binding protein [Halopseudomonas sp.]
MKFQNVAVAESEGLLLAHTLSSGEYKLSKGRPISYEDVQKLTLAGAPTVAAVELSHDDINERDAAIRIAEALQGNGLYLDLKPSGSVDLRAIDDGLLLIDKNVIDGCNLLAESVTIATQLPNRRTAKGERVATVKVIPYAVASHVVETICQCLNRYDDVIAVKRFQALKVGLIQTEKRHQRDPKLEKTQQVIQQRLQPVSAAIESVTVCDHSSVAIQQAITEQKNSHCDVIVIVSPTATVDRDDLVPASIKQMGGQIEHYGMPVEPGHMLLLAYSDSTPIIGAPTCIRSPRDNGFDRLLDRLACGLSVRGTDIMKMGVGGLLV